MKNLILTLVFLFFSLNLSFAQQKPAEDALAQYLFAPELVMTYQNTIDLTEEQQQQIASEMTKAQEDFMDLSWKMTKKSEEFKKLLSKSTVNEVETLTQLGEMLNLENQTKKRQLSLLIRIKNILSQQQQEQLNKLK